MLTPRETAFLAFRSTIRLTGPSSLRACAAAICLASLCAMPTSASITWNGGGGSGDFSDPANWGGVDPDGNGDGILDDPDLRFGGGVQTNVAFDQDYSGIDSIIFIASADSFTLSGDGAGGSETISFNSGASIVNNSAQTGDITFASDLTLDFNGTNALIANNDTDGDSDLIFNGNMQLANNLELQINASDPDARIELNGIISGSGAMLNLIGPGRVIITSANTFTGGVELGGGFLRIGDASALGTGNLRVTGDANLAAVNMAIEDVMNNVIISASADLTIDGTNDLNLDGNISGSGGLTVEMAGPGSTLTLGGDNSYSGGTILTTGTVLAEQSSGFGTGDINVNGTDGSIGAGAADLTFTNDVSVDEDAIFGLTGAESFVLSGDIEGLGGLSIDMDVDAFVTLSGNNQDLEGPVSIDGLGGVILGRDNALGTGMITVNADGEIQASSIDTLLDNDIDLNGSDLTFGGENSILINGTISGTGGLIFDGTGDGRFDIRGENTFTGTSVLESGFLQLGSDTALGDAAGGAQLIINGGRLDATGGDRVIDVPVTVGGDFRVINLNGNTLEMTGDWDLGDADRTITMSNTDRFEISGDITSVGQNDRIIKDGIGFLVLSGNNAGWNGGITLDGGTLGLGSDTGWGGGGLDVISDSTILARNGERSYSGAISLDGIELTIGGADDLTISGAITESAAGASLRIATSAIVTLTNGGNDFSDGISLVSGTLLAANDGALGSGEISGIGGSLGGSGGTTTISNAIELITSLTLTGASDLTMNSVIAGVGQLRIDMENGSDSVDLNAANTFTGTLSLESGELTLNNGAAVADGTLVTLGGNDATLLLGADETIGGLGGDGTVTLGGNALTVAGNFITDFDGTIGGNGDLFVTDMATLNLNGVNSYIGDTRVQSGGTLGGSGSIAGDVFVEMGGTISAGNSDGIGTLNIGNDLDLASGANYEATLSASQLDGDLLAVDGTATLGSGSTISIEVGQEPGAYIVSNTTFEILTAAGGITDNGVSILNDSATLNFYNLADIGVDPDFDSGDNSLSVIATRAANAFSDPDFIDSGNNRRVGAALDELIVLADAGGGQNDAADLLAQLQGLNAEALNDAITAITPTAANAAASIQLSGATKFNSVQTAYFSAARGGMTKAFMANAMNPNVDLFSSGSLVGALASSTNDPRLLAEAIAMQDDADNNRLRFSRGQDRRWSGFVRAYGLQTDQDAEGERVGYDGSFAGVQGGLDTMIGENGILGLAIGFQSGDADILNSVGDIDADTFRIGPYYSYDGGTWYFDASLSIGFSDYEQKREIAIAGMGSQLARSAYDGDDLVLYVGAGYDVRLRRGWTLTPNASLQYANFNFDGYEETGASPNNLRISDRSQDSIRVRGGTMLSARIENDRVTMVPEFGIGLEYELEGYDDVEATFLAGGSPFSISSGEPDELAVYFNAGVTALFNDSASVYMRYDGLFGNGSDTHGVSGGFSLRF